MPRKIRRPLSIASASTPAPSKPPRWAGFVLIALLGVLLGAGGTYLALLPTLKKVAVLQAAVDASAAVRAAATPTAPVPPLNLTETATPAQAALNLGNWYEDQAARAESGGDTATAAANYAQAISKYSAAIADGLDNPDIRTDLGVAYYKFGDPAKALAQYQKAQQQNSGHENSLFNQGAAYAVLAQQSKAIAAWQAYLRRFPKGQHVADAKQLIADVQAHGLPGSPSQKAAGP